MQRLYLSLLRNKDHLIFILAVSLSYSLLLTNDNPNVLLLRGKSSDLFARISAPITWVKTLVRLEEETQLLREKNIQLTLEMESLIQAGEENSRLRELLGFQRESNLTLLPARVLNAGVSAIMTSLTVDVGQLNEVAVNQPVITPEGVVGKTVVVGEKTATVQLLSDLNYRLSVRIIPSGAVGILRWKNGNLCEVWEIQKNAAIGVGDRVVTSGFSQIYPRNLPVGEVIGILDERGSFQKIAQVRIKSELGSLMNVFIVTEVRDEVD